MSSKNTRRRNISKRNVPKKHSQTYKPTKRPNPSQVPTQAATPPPAELPKPTQKGYWRRSFKFVYAILTLLSITASLIVFLPRVVVNPPSVPVDSSNVLSVSFDVVNAGFIPLEDVQASVGLGQVSRTVPLERNLIPTFDSRIARMGTRINRLGQDERFTLVGSDYFGMIRYADIAIVVTYRPWFIPFSRTKTFRFFTSPRVNGQSYWQSWPLGERLLATI